jgi:hypothetical protein
MLFVFLLSSNKTISANNTPSVSPCSSPTILKKDVFTKIAAFTATGKSSVENSTSQSSTSAPPAHHIHRHHRNTSTVSQNENILTSQPSTQSIGISSDQSYSSVNTEHLSSNGTTPPVHHVPRRQQQPAAIVSSPQTSDSIQMELSPSNHHTNSPMSTSSNAPQTPNNNQWRHKLNNLKQSFQSVGTPRFHRRPKVLRKCFLVNKHSHQYSTSEHVCRLVNENDNSLTSNSPSQYGTTPEATKKSLFHHIIDAMQEDHHMIVVKDRPLSAIKTDLIHAFLSVCHRN